MLKGSAFLAAGYRESCALTPSLGRDRGARFGARACLYLMTAGHATAVDEHTSHASPTAGSSWDAAASGLDATGRKATRERRRRCSLRLQPHAEQRDDMGDPVDNRDPLAAREQQP